MSIKNVLIIGILITIFLPCAFADTGIVGQSTTFWANIIDATTGNYYNATSANISIYYPNTSIAVNNVAMTKVSTGLYAYIYIPNNTGIYYTETQFFNNTQLLTTASASVYVTENEDMYLAILFGLISIIIGSFWYSAFVRSKPTTTVNAWIIETLTTKDIAVVFDVLGSLLFIPLLALLQIWSAGQQYASIFDKLFIVGTLVVGFGVLLYIIFYLVYRYNENLERLADMASGKVKNGGKR